MPKGVDNSPQQADLVGVNDDHEVRIKALESGAHPTRYEQHAGVTTPWFPLEKAAGWSGSVFWRLAQSVVQMRGLLTGPSGWGDGATAVFLPLECIPAWPTWQLCPTGGGAVTRVQLTVAGSLVAFRDVPGHGSLYLDNIRFPRG